MELIMISSSKLKIMLSADDMTKYALDADIDYSDQKTRQAFRTILNEAREKTGFDAESEKIFIQIYPSKKGGCEVYITKIDDDSEYECSGLPLKLPETKFLYKCIERSAGIIPPQRKRASKERKRAYSFYSLSDAIAVCRRLLSIGWRGQSSAYCDENRVFYIILKDKNTQELSHLDRLSFIIEYGNTESHNSIVKYLCEHGSCICKSGAVEKLGNL